MKDKAIRLMLFDVAKELLDAAKAARDEAARSNSDYDKGRQFAFYEVISLLVQQANAFGIDRRDIGLEHIDPERDLLAK